MKSSTISLFVTLIAVAMVASFYGGVTIGMKATQTEIYDSGYDKGCFEGLNAGFQQGSTSGYSDAVAAQKKKNGDIQQELKDVYKEVEEAKQKVAKEIPEK